MSSAQILANATRDALTAVGHRRLIRIPEDGRRTDFAVNPNTPSSCIIRCVERPSAADYCALSAMLAAGDFLRAALVCSRRGPSTGSGGVECWSIDDIGGLAATLSLEQAVL